MKVREQIMGNHLQKNKNKKNSGKLFIKYKKSKNKRKLFQK